MEMAVVAMVGVLVTWSACCGLDTEDDRWAPPVHPFSKFLKIAETCKSKTDAFLCSKFFPILYAPRLEYSEQLFQLYDLQIPNRIHVINPGTDSNFNIL
jgi:hypothetical protein